MRWPFSRPHQRPAKSVGGYTEIIVAALSEVAGRRNDSTSFCHSRHRGGRWGTLTGLFGAAQGGRRRLTLSAALSPRAFWARSGAIWSGLAKACM